MPLQATSISQRVFTTQPGTSLMLRGNEFTQPLALRERWNKIRIGLFCSINSDTANNLHNTGLSIGLCSAGRPLSSDNANFIGHCFGNYYYGSTWTYTANSGNPYAATASFYSITKIGTTLNPQSVGSLTTFLPINPATVARRGIIISDITKAQPNWTPWGNSLVVAHMSLNLTIGDFYSVMEQSAANPTIQGSAFSGWVGTAVPFSETAAAPVSTLNILWNQWRFPLEIYAIAVYQVN